MAITDEDEENIVRAIVADIDTTIGPGHEGIVRANAKWLRQFVDGPLEYYADSVTDATQQEIHDGYIDTDWPRCPLHGRHPLWCHNGRWWCEKDDVLMRKWAKYESIPTG